MSSEATIAAISSPAGGAARAVIRLSGPAARGIVESCCHSGGAPVVLARRGGLRARLDDGSGQQPVLILWMPAPGSFTGEDVAELHLAGSPPLVRAALARTVALGAVLAQPGEFTRRAFENGRLDLARAEGVLALVHARNQDERRAASALLLGGLSRRVELLRERLEELRAACEASLDFDEGDTGAIPRAELLAQCDAVVAAIEDARAWELARDPPAGLPRAVLVGAPNAGKSSLFNRLSEGAALVSDLPGTTRDALRRRWSARGLELELWDAAGAASDSGGAAADPDRLAQDRAAELRAAADLWLWVVDASLDRRDLRAELQQLTGNEPAPPVLLVLHKLDLAPDTALDPVRRAHALGVGTLVQGVAAASSKSGAGLEGVALEAERLLSAGGTAGEIRALSARHRQALDAARERLVEARGLLAGDARLDLAAHALRLSTDELDQIQGRTTPEDLLTRIFQRFCLGK